MLAATHRGYKATAMPTSEMAIATTNGKPSETDFYTIEGKVSYKKRQCRQGKAALESLNP